MSRQQLYNAAARRTAAENLLKENDGYAGTQASLESLYIVGSKVLIELIDNWDVYEDSIPGAVKCGVSRCGFSLFESTQSEFLLVISAHLVISSR